MTVPRLAVRRQTRGKRNVSRFGSGFRYLPSARPDSTPINPFPPGPTGTWRSYGTCRIDDGAWDGVRTGLDIDILDVGQGDDIVVWFPNGKTMMVDLDSTKNKDIVTDDSFFYFSQHTTFARTGETLDYLILTHCDRDHYNTIAPFIQNFRSSRSSDRKFSTLCTEVRLESTPHPYVSSYQRKEYEEYNLSPDIPGENLDLPTFTDDGWFQKYDNYGIFSTSPVTGTETTQRGSTPIPRPEANGQPSFTDDGSRPLHTPTKATSPGSCSTLSTPTAPDPCHQRPR